MLRDVAPVTTQLRVEDPPAVMADGVAVKLDMTGAVLFTVTVTVAVTLPDALMAVRVYVVVVTGVTTWLVLVTIPIP